MYSFLGMNKDQWDIANAVAACVGAIGTMLAVVVSLWLAQRNDKIKLRAVAGERVLITLGVGDSQSFVAVVVTNVGRRPAKVTHLGWKVGKRKSMQHFAQLIQRDRLSSTLPVVLDDGEEAQWLFPLDEWLADWPEYLGTNWAARAHDMRVCVGASAARTVEQRIEKGLRDKLKDHCSKASSS